MRSFGEHLLIERNLDEFYAYVIQFQDKPAKHILSEIQLDPSVELLGSDTGATFATIFTKNFGDPYIVKAIVRGADRAFEEYVKHFDSSNPLFPKVIATYGVRDAHNDIIDFYFMDYLEVHPRQNAIRNGRFWKDVMNTAPLKSQLQRLRFNQTLEDLMNLLENHETFEKDDIEILDTLIKKHYKISLQNFLDWMNVVDKVIYQQDEFLDGRVDLHSGNYGYLNNEQLVIFDPVISDEDSMSSTELF